MQKNIIIQIVIAVVMSAGVPLFSQSYIADYRVAKEDILRSIPVEYINKAKAELVVAYQHTSHGTHVSRGMYGLQGYKSGDDVLFGISATPSENKLEFRDFALEDYAPEGVTAIDLSTDETAFIQTTRNYLDASENATVNVIMWSWCNIAGHHPDINYLPGMDDLISEYGAGGSKIGTGEGQRELPVTFVYMTGHANKDANTGPLNPKEQAALVVDNCVNNQQFCLDYYSIDTHAMDDTYYEDTGDNGDSDTYGGNFYEDWQNSHTLGVDYYENWQTPDGYVVFGEHNTQHITANRKGYAMWWILARIAGWQDGQEGVQVTSITVSTAGEVTSLNEGTTLQCSTTVLPADASNPSVEWSLVNGTGSATISSGGLVTAVSAGTVEVVATAVDGSGVSGSLNLTINDPDGILNQAGNHSIQLYPNPSTGQFYIEPQQYNISEISVFDVSGKEVLRVSPSELTSRISIDLTGNPSGIYGVKFSDDHGDLWFSKLVLVE